MYTIAHSPLILFGLYASGVLTVFCFIMAVREAFIQRAKRRARNAELDREITTYLNRLKPVPYDGIERRRHMLTGNPGGNAHQRRIEYRRRTRTAHTCADQPNFPCDACNENGGAQ